ncbi:MAG TPA: hypothetical protein VM598_05290, partial [Bdellovibrionota bacterium]|nr:hypothetical protein [Bdellovibrionota bacterium]
DFERARIARDFPAFVRKLPAGADYRIAVMEAHGGASEFSGRVYSPEGVPAVLSSAEHSEAEVQKYLKRSLCETEEDADFASGEAGFYSFLRSLDADRLAEARAKGFYRPEAGLSVVFVTDENDICFRPELHGYTEFPDYVDGGRNERKAYEKYCLNADGTEKITPASVAARLKGFKGSQPVSVGGVVHVDPDKVPCIGQDAIGHGILELLTSLSFDTAIEITSQLYAEGLARLADLSTLVTRLLSDFALTDSPAFIPATLRAQIDGVAVPISYTEATRTVHVQGTNLGQGGSIVSVEACPVGGTDPGGIGS